MARILICDDAVFMRMTIREALEGAGHAVIGEAEDGAGAINIYVKEKPDLVMMDILMKDSGVDAVRQIIGLNPKAKIVIVSILGEQEEEVVEAIRCGALGIVTKPIRRELLVAEVQRVLERP